MHSKSLQRDRKFLEDDRKTEKIYEELEVQCLAHQASGLSSSRILP